jgi:hypothetical protein
MLYCAFPWFELNFLRSLLEREAVGLQKCYCALTKLTPFIHG